MMATLPARVFTAAEVDAAVARIASPERLQHAQEVVTHAAPALERVLGETLAQGGYFGPAHDQEVRRAALEEDSERRLELVQGLVSEETRLGMLVGATVGFQLHSELTSTQPED
jgi:hypothetical protein